MSMRVATLRQAKYRVARVSSADKWVKTDVCDFDIQRLSHLYQTLGDAQADYVVGFAVEDLALRVAECERLWHAAERVALAACADALCTRAEQVGMKRLAHVARIVGLTGRGDDPVALAATLARMVRVAERSLTLIWDWREYAP